jgi:signal transduction histidine kinase
VFETRSRSAAGPFSFRLWIDDRTPPRVRLLGRAAKTALVLSVADSGSGIKPEDQPKLFQAFSQLDSTSTRHAEGAGLGLYLCQNLANLLGGSLSLSCEFGAGSTFTLTLRDKSLR